MPLTYCTRGGQKEEITWSKFVLGRKIWYWIVYNFFFSTWMGKNTRNSLCLCVPVRSHPLVAPVKVQRLILRCTKNWQPFWRVVTCQHFGFFFSLVSVFYSGSFMQVHKGSRCLSVQVTSCSVGMHRDLTVCMWMLSPGGWFHVFGGNQPLWDT